MSEEEESVQVVSVHHSDSVHHSVSDIGGTESISSRRQVKTRAKQHQSSHSDNKEDSSVERRSEKRASMSFKSVSEGHLPMISNTRLA